MYLSKNLETIRKHLRENQSEFGERYGVGRSAVSKWEAGENEPPLRVLMALEDLTGVSMTRMLRDELSMDDLDSGGGMLREPAQVKPGYSSSNDFFLVLETLNELKKTLEEERGAAAAEREVNARFRKEFELLKKKVELMDRELVRMAGNTKRK